MSLGNVSKLWRCSRDGKYLMLNFFCFESVQQAYWELKREMSNLQLVTEVQTEVLRKLKTNITATKKGKSVFAVTDLTKTNRRSKLYHFKKKLAIISYQNLIN